MSRRWANAAVELMVEAVRRTATWEGLVVGAAVSAVVAWAGGAAGGSVATATGDVVVDALLVLGVVAVVSVVKRDWEDAAAAEALERPPSCSRGETEPVLTTTTTTATTTTTMPTETMATPALPPTLAHLVEQAAQKERALSPDTREARRQATLTLFHRFFDPATTPATTLARTRNTIVAGDGMAAARRALIAREWVLKDAVELIERQLAWRERERVDDVLAHPLPPPVVERIRRGLCDGFCGVDREGYPIYWARLGGLDFASLKADVGLATILRYHVQVMEFNQRVYYARLSRQANRTINRMTMIFDLDGFSAWNVGSDFWAVMKAVTGVDEAFYSEFFSRCIIVNAPSFYRVFWATVSLMLCEDTRAKFVVLPSLASLADFVDPDAIPESLGGRFKGVAWTSARGPYVRTQHAAEFDAFVATDNRGERG